MPLLLVTSKRKQNMMGRALTLPILKWQQHDEEGVCPSLSRPKGNEKTTGRVPALPVMEQQQHDEKGHVPSSSHCGNDVVPVRVVNFFFKKGNFDGRTLYAQPLNLVPQPPQPSHLRSSTPSSSSHHGYGIMVVV